MKTVKTQQLGHLIALDLNLDIVGISQNIFKLSSPDSQLFLRKNFDTLLASLDINDSSRAELVTVVKSYINEDNPRALLTVQIHKVNYYLKISKLERYIYIEAEEQFRDHISTSELNDIGFLFENKYHGNWNFLCRAINKIIQFERVYVLKLQDTGSGNIIAEANNGLVPSYINEQFSKSFMPPEIIDFFKGTPYRYLPNTEASLNDFYALEDDINVHSTQLQSPPDLQLRYFNYIGVKSVIIFPLFLHGKFWGVVVAYNKEIKKVDLQNRKICTFIVQNAMSKYEAFMKQGLLDINSQVQSFKNKLMTRLATHKSIHDTMVESMEDLQHLLNSDGIAIYNEGEVYFKGHTPDHELFYEIVKFIQENATKVIFTNHNFKKKYKHHFSKKLPFAGLLSYNVDNNNDYFIIWFRKENIVMENQIEFNTDFHFGLHSYLTTVYDTAKPWSDEELIFLEGLEQTLNHSLMKQLLENKQLTNNLSELNNELEMFTYTLSHDLKNPLSILTMGIEFLKTRHKELSIENREKWFNNLSLGLDNIQEIINNIINLSQHKVKKINKDTIQLNYFIRKIVEETRLVYDDIPCKIEYGQLLPVQGEKSAIYQIFNNIISNAFKYSKNVNDPKIHIHSYEEDCYIVYEVIDNGIGIPAKDLKHIFEMFGRAKNAQKYNGNGIGLALVKRIMERLEGIIDIKSKEQEGTTVIMKFPYIKSFPN